MISKLLVSGGAVAAMLSFAMAGETGPIISGKWRITRSVVAPWADEAAAGGAASLVGSIVAFNANAVKAPHPIGCANAKYEATDVPTEGLFQGAELDRDNDAVVWLGLSAASIKGVSVTCDSGIFEYHYADADTLYLGLDNRIWVLDQTAGTRASKSSAEGVVQRFLEAHFAGDMGFSPEALATKRRFFSKALERKIDTWFAKPQDPNVAPEINGDPFTDSQEYPARFSVAADDKTAARISVPVEFANADLKRTAFFEMTRQKGRWLIDDVAYEDGSKLSALLEE